MWVGHYRARRPGHAALSTGRMHGINYHPGESNYFPNSMRFTFFTDSGEGKYNVCKSFAHALIKSQAQETSTALIIVHVSNFYLVRSNSKSPLYK
jgi:hypothetical protein